MKVLPTIHIHSGRSITHLGEWPGEDPLVQIEQLMGLGCSRIAMVDVDAAQGSGHNRDVMTVLMRRFRYGNPKACIQVGGGIRGSDHAQFFMDQGATWLLVGTLLYKSPLAVDQMVARFHEHLTAAIDARGGEVRRGGWAVPSDLSAGEMARRVREHGFRRILFVDIPGAAGGEPDLATARTILEHARLPLFMGGSIRGTEDARAALAVPGVQGVQVDAAVVLRHPELIAAMTGICG